MNLLADALFAAAVVIVLGVVALRVAQLPAFELREVRIDGTLRHVTRGEIEEVVRRELRGGFFTLNLAATRAAFERLPWVRSVNVRRLWPDGVEITLAEHVPFAHWGRSALVNTHGEVFQAQYDGQLPVFTGPEGAAREIAIQYRYFVRSLAAIGQTPVEVQVTARRAWQVKLESGLTLALGRESIEARLDRFVAAYERTLGGLGRRIDYVDLRYASGFAVRIPELRLEKPGPGRARRTG